MPGDASPEAGITSASGKTKVFAGRRFDPFFFNLVGFQETAKFIGANATALLAGADPAGCPRIDAITSNILVTKLKSAANCMPPAACTPGVDFFKDLQTLAIVVSVDTALVTPGGKVLGVWGSTNK